MAENPINARQRQKYDTSTNWATNNPILLAGEIGVESDTNKIKIGNGISNWNNLQYIGGEDGGTAVDLIISTQEEFENLLENETWYDARTVVFNGTFDLSDGKYVSIPHTTYEIIGINNATIVAKGSIGVSPDENTSWRYMFYRTMKSPSGSGLILASDGRQKLRVMNISLNLTNVTVETGEYDRTVGFYNISNMTNCYVEWMKDRSDNTGYCLCGFFECYNLCNCSVVGRAEIICEGFSLCSNLANCFANVNGKTDTKAFDGCKMLTNCKADAGVNSTYGRTVYNFYGCSYLVNCPMTEYSVSGHIETNKSNKYITATLEDLPNTIPYEPITLTTDLNTINKAGIYEIPYKLGTNTSLHYPADVGGYYVWQNLIVLRPANADDSTTYGVQILVGNNSYQGSGPAIFYYRLRGNADWSNTWKEIRSLSELRSRFLNIKTQDEILNATKGMGNCVYTAKVRFEGDSLDSNGLIINSQSGGTSWNSAQAQLFVCYGIGEDYGDRRGIYYRFRYKDRNSNSYIWSDWVKIDLLEYAKLTGNNVFTGNNTHSGTETFNSNVKLANNTWNEVGDDVAVGDCNQAGCFGIKGLNGNTGIAFQGYNSSNIGKIIYNASTDTFEI